MDCVDFPEVEGAPSIPTGVQFLARHVAFSCVSLLLRRGVLFTGNSYRCDLASTTPLLKLSCAVPETVGPRTVVQGTLLIVGR